MGDPLVDGNNQETTDLWEAEPPRILSNRDRDIFLALLDSDPEPTEAAKKAVARFNKSRREGEVYHFPPEPEADAAPREN